MLRANNKDSKYIGFNEKISIIIPTLNRSEYLIRALHYYNKVGFTGYICVGDSSEQEHAKQLSEFIDKKVVNHNLKIIYKYYPKSLYTLIDVVNELFALVPTPYVVSSGDDDFLVSPSLAKCVEFLEMHSDYIAVHGIRMSYRLDSKKPFGNIVETHYTCQHEWESDKASLRWPGYMRYANATLYFVHRRSAYKRMLQDTSKVKSHYLGAELLPCSFTPILGKVKKIDCLSTLFEIKGGDEKEFSWDTHSMYKFLLAPDWYQSVLIVKQNIVKGLMAADSITQIEASEIFDREFCNHIIVFLSWQYKKKFGESISSKAFETIGRNINEYISIYELITSPDWHSKVIKAREEGVMGLLSQKMAKNESDAKSQYDKYLWKYLLVLMSIQYQIKYQNQRIDIEASIKSNSDDFKSKLSVKSLLDPSSPYHNDFMPVYEILLGRYE